MAESDGLLGFEGGLPEVAVDTLIETLVKVPDVGVAL